MTKKQRAASLARSAIVNLAPIGRQERKQIFVAIWGKQLTFFPQDTDPVASKWPAKGHRASIIDTAPRAVILRTLQALVRDGAVSAWGIDDSGELHYVDLTGAQDAA